jgi:circadian clock protein KaiB
MESNADLDASSGIGNKLVLQLYVSGMSANSMRAIGNIKRLCEEYLKEGFDLEIIDIYKNPSLAEEQQIVFTPSLIKLQPLPKKIFIGSMSDTKKLIDGLRIINNE